MTILYASCYLHDIGLQYERASELDVIPPDKLQQPWDALSDKGKRSILRRYHHLISAKLVHLSANAATPAVGLHLGADYHPDRIAALCEAHCLETASDRYTELTTDYGGIRMGLLSALLRIADILDESRRRANRARAQTLNLDVESETHWWRHYYTSNIEFDEPNTMIVVEFEFPPDRADEYARIVPDLQMPSIGSELRQHQTVLNRNGLAWNLDHTVAQQPYSTTEAMPANVLMEMLKQLKRRESARIAAQRAADLQALEQAQPFLRKEQRQLEVERDQLSPREYLTRLHQHARNRWELGGKRAAWTMLRSPFEQHAELLPPTERVKIAIELARWMCEDAEAFEALRILRRVEGAAQVPEVDAETRQRFGELLATTANDNAEHELADHSIERATASAQLEQDRLRLHAEHAEWRFLRGALADGELPEVGAPTTSESPLSWEAVKGTGREGDIMGCLPAHARFGIVQALATVFGEGCAAALRRVDILERAISSEQPVVRAVLVVARARILFLDGRANDSLEVLDRLIKSVESRAPANFMLTLLDNRGAAGLAQLEFDEMFYQRADERRLRGIKLRDESAVLDAILSAKQGKHYEAVPALWRQVGGAYRRQSWWAMRWSHARLADEMLQIGDFPSAVWHAALACDIELAEQIGKTLCRISDAAAITATVNVLLRLGKLRRCAQVACIVFREILDVVPDDHIPGIYTFLIAEAAQEAGDRELHNRLAASWEALDALILRLNGDDRDRTVRTAVSHSIWSQAVPTRKQVVKTVWHAVTLGVSSETLKIVTQATLPLAAPDSKSDFDYEQVIELLCQLADQDAEAKKTIGDELFPNDKPSNTVLAQIAPLFERSMENLDDVAREAARQIRLQVQRLAPGQEPEQLGYMTARKVEDDGVLAVCLGGGQNLLQAVCAHVHRLSKETLAEIADAVFESLFDNDNMLENRALLVVALRQHFVECLDEPAARRALEILRSLASGDFRKSRVAPAMTDHPLSRVSIRGMNPGALRGIALEAMGVLAERFPNLHDDQFASLLMNALLDPDPELRKYGFIAARNAADLTGPLLSAILIGTQDSSAETAHAAWSVLKELQGKFPFNYWDVVLFACARAVHHPDASVRRAAAAAISSFGQHCVDQHARSNLTALLERFSKDSCYSVRRATSPV